MDKGMGKIIKKIKKFAAVITMIGALASNATAANISQEKKERIDNLATEIELSLSRCEVDSEKIREFNVLLNEAGIRSPPNMGRELEILQQFYQDYERRIESIKNPTEGDLDPKYKIERLIKDLIEVEGRLGIILEEERNAIRSLIEVGLEDLRKELRQKSEESPRIYEEAGRKETDELRELDNEIYKLNRKIGTKERLLKKLSFSHFD